MSQIIIGTPADDTKRIPPIGTATADNPTSWKTLIDDINANFTDIYTNGAGTLIGSLIGANMNVTTDQQIPLRVPAGHKFRVTKISVNNASVSLTTAAGGVYRAAAKAGTALVAAGQVYTALSAATIALDLTLSATTVVEPAGESLYLSLTTPQGVAATADVYVYGDIY